MTAIEAWRAKVGSRQQANRSAAKPFTWDDKRAAWFNRFATRDRTPTYDLFRSHVTGDVLEIGPGPGAYTRLLVRDASRVVAVEPSPSMVELLHANLPGQPNLEIVPSTIEDYLPHLGSFDFALAANVLGGIERLDEVLTAVTDKCRCLIISSWDVKLTPAWQTATETELLRRPRGHGDGPLNEDMLAVLGELGLTYEVLQLSRPSFPFDQADALLGWVAGYLDVPEEHANRLADLVLPHCQRQGERWFLPSGRESMLLRVPGRVAP